MKILPQEVISIQLYFKQFIFFTNSSTLLNKNNFPSSFKLIYSTVTLLAKFRGLSTSHPRSIAI